MSFDSGFGSEIVDVLGAGDFESFKFGAGGDDEILGSVFLIADGNRVAI